MRKSRKQDEAVRPIIKVGATYRDTQHGALVTVEDHELVGGKRTGRVIVIGAGVGEHFPRRWICPAEDLVEIGTGTVPEGPGQGERT